MKRGFKLNFFLFYRRPSHTYGNKHQRAPTKGFKLWKGVRLDRVRGKEESFIILSNIRVKIYLSFWVKFVWFQQKKSLGKWKDLDPLGADFVSEIVPWARTSDFPSIFPLFPSHLSQLIKRKTSNYVTETIFMVKQQDFSTEQMIKDTYFLCL